MSSKSERLLNLTICLLSTKRYLPKEEIRKVVAGYQGQNDVAFERMFERDKDELRALGIPIETGTIDHYFEDEKGYRIPPASFELPPIELAADEAAVLGVAARAWRETTMASATLSAMSKLRGAGIEPDTNRLAALEPIVTAREPSFAALMQAARDRVRVRFTYRDNKERTLEPWGLTSSKGRWYVIGRDVDRDDTRMFRLSRISSDPRSVSKQGAFSAPADLDLRALARSLEPPELTATAVLALRRNKAPALRRRGTPIPPTGQPWSDVTLPEGFEVFEVGFSSRQFLVSEVASHAADVLVLHPPELRDRVVEHLRTVLATHQPAAQSGAGG
ncbi:MAG: helix-turn-helix transcriptional regulator [Propionibacteriaceae bacterium]